LTNATASFGFMFSLEFGIWNFEFGVPDEDSGWAGDGCGGAIRNRKSEIRDPRKQGNLTRKRSCKAAFRRLQQTACCQLICCRAAPPDLAIITDPRRSLPA
jgi:hypothetical protein